jgi:WD40 repeat protein/serine/threonine protein kinase
LGDYALLTEIGRGDAGVVYKARQISRDQVVAVKTLPFASEAFMHRFRAATEAVAANLVHANIVPIHDVGEQDGQHYFSMDYVDGPSLAALTEDHPLPAARAARYAQKIAQAIQYAHDSDILHGDLKPSNVLIDANDEPRITDFGLARTNVELGTRKSELTLSSQPTGSPCYLPPEQAIDQWGTVGPQSDVYSIGAILYQLLTARRPFVGESREDTLQQVLKVEPVAPCLLNPATPQVLESICLRCLEKSPQRRYSSARELSDDLGRFLRHEPIRAQVVTRREKIRRWCRRRPSLVAVMVILVVMAASSTISAIALARLGRSARWNAYVTDLNQAHNDWQQGNFAQAFSTLRRHLPHGREPDLRGFEWRHLWTLSQGTCAFKLPQPGQVVGSLMYSPDGESVATFSEDKFDRLKVWNLKTRMERFEIADAGSFGGFSANGRWFVVGGADGSVNVHDAENGKFIFSIPRVGKIVAFAPQNNSVVALDTNGNVRVLKLENQGAAPIITQLARRDFDLGAAWPMAVTPDGRWLAVIRPGSPGDREDSGVEIWDAVNKSEPKFLPLERQIRTLQFSPDGQKLAVADGNGSVYLCDRMTMETRAFHAHELPILSLAFSPDGHTLATGSSDETIQLWEVATLAQMARNIDGQIGPVCSLAFSPDGKFLASGGQDSPVRFWNLDAVAATALVTNLKTDKAGNFAFSPDTTLMAAGCLDNTVKIWDVTTFEERYRFTNASHVVAFTSDGKKLLAATASGVASWRDFSSGANQSLPGQAGLAQATAANLSSDRRLALIGRGDGSIQLLEIASGRILDTYRGHADAVTAVAYASGGTRFVSGSRDKTIRLWDVKNPENSLKTWSDHPSALNAMAISSDGKMVVSGYSDGAIRFRDLRRAGNAPDSIHRHRSAIRSLAISPDNRILASGGDDKAVKLWDLASLRQLGSFEFDDAIRYVAFSPDGNNLAVVTDNGTLRLLRALTLSEADEENRTYYRSSLR